ncbi:hypothetical protein CUR85_17665 [Sulfitobacter faviae]|nr:hypothetical protein [Sulfitobacter faviae]
MTDTTIAQAEPVLVAIDIAKAHHEVLIAVPGKKRLRSSMSSGSTLPSNRWRAGGLHSQQILQHDVVQHGADQ